MGIIKCKIFGFSFWFIFIGIICIVGDFFWFGFIVCFFYSKGIFVVIGESEVIRVIIGIFVKVNSFFLYFFKNEIDNENFFFLLNFFLKKFLIFLNGFYVCLV